VQAADAAAAQVANTIPKSDTWELDFCSRPMLDERGKKVWELLITDQDRTFQYSQYFPNSKINSVEVSSPPLGLQHWGGPGSKVSPHGHLHLLGSLPSCVPTCTIM
jgi:hypothetical protein